MNVLIVLAHPAKGSLNSGLANIAVRRLRALGHCVELDDLYAEGFDPVEREEHYVDRTQNDHFDLLTEQRTHFNNGKLPEDVKAELERIDSADLVIFQFPLWWHAQPAILKGWFDRVFVYGGVYSSKRRYDRGLFRGKKAICSVTTGSPAQTFTSHGRSGNIVEWLWPIHSSLYYVGFDVLAPQVNYGVQAGGIVYQNEESFGEHLKKSKLAWEKRLTSIESDNPIPFSGWSDWDENGLLKSSHPFYWRP